VGGPVKGQSWGCRACPIRSESLVCRAGEADPAAFQRLVHRFVYQPRQVVFYEGHPCLGVFMLCSGKVKLTVTSSSGHCRIVRIVGAGELIERAGFCEGAVHEVTCEALEPSQVCLLYREGYLALLAKNPALAVQLLQLVSRDVQPLRAAGEPFPHRKTASRFAALLFDLSKRFGRREPEGIKLDIRLSREELAELIGAAPETVIRLLSRFKKERLVATNGSEITLLSPDRIGKLAASSHDSSTDHRQDSA
jgi:CRP/FNR family transcriptional regulator